MNKKHLFVSAAMSALIGIGSIVSGFSSGTTVLAAGNTPVQGPVVYAQKYLIMDEEANVPNVTFKYKIESGKALPYNKQENKSAVISGPVTGATIGKAVFSAKDAAYTEKQAHKIKTGIQDTVSLKKGQKYARSDVKIDLSQVTYTEPGVYRYKIIEDSSTSIQAVTFDKADTRYLDVYIHSDDNGKLSYAGSILHKTESDVLANGTNPPDKDNGFENLYTTHNLTISKKVTGNQASHNRYFAFTVKISSAVPGTVYDVKLNGASETVTQDGKSHTNSKKLTTLKDGTVTATYMLRHGESVCIQGLADSTKYTISEDSQDYDPSFKIDNGSIVEKSATDETAIHADTAASFTNERKGVVPTGLFENGSVWAVLLTVGIIGFVIAFRKKRG